MTRSDAALAPDRGVHEPELPRLKRSGPSPSHEQGVLPTPSVTMNAPDEPTRSLSPSMRRSPQSQLSPRSESYLNADVREPLRKSPRYEFAYSPHSETRTRFNDSPVRNYNSIAHRRGHHTRNKAPELHLTVEDNYNERHGVDVNEPSIRSAPPHQDHFDIDARLPPPSTLLRPGEREAARHAARLSPELRRSSLGHHQDLQNYLPTPGGTPHVFQPQHPPLLSPAYHTTHFGRHAMHGTPDRLSAADASFRSGDMGETSFGNGAPPRSPVANKMQFLSLFSDFFDSLSDSRTLKSTLEHQIRASDALLQTLQRASKVFDETIDRRLHLEGRAWEARFARLEQRIHELESRSNASEQFTAASQHPM